MKSFLGNLFKSKMIGKLTNFNEIQLIPSGVELQQVICLMFIFSHGGYYLLVVSMTMSGSFRS